MWTLIYTKVTKCGEKTTLASCDQIVIIINKCNLPIIFYLLELMSSKNSQVKQRHFKENLAKISCGGHGSHKGGGGVPPCPPVGPPLLVHHSNITALQNV